MRGFVVYICIMQLGTTYIICTAIDGQQVTIGPADPQQGMQIRQTTLTITNQTLLSKFQVGQTMELKVLAPEL